MVYLSEARTSGAAITHCSSLVSDGLECVGISLLISANDERIAVALQAQAVNQCMRRPLWSAKLIPYTWYLHLY